MKLTYGNMSLKSKELLQKLISDYKSGLLPEERIYSPGDGPALIYNLTNGNYSYSFKQMKELELFFKVNS